MQAIPTPRLLDPDRPLSNERGGFTVNDEEPPAEQFKEALRDTCEYAQQLWDNLNAVREYLMTSLPADPRSPGPHPNAGASPTGPDDEEGWQNWIAAYASVTSVLCGPQGDSGYGLGEARHAAEERRSAPVLRLYADHPNLGGNNGSAPEPVERREDDGARARTATQTPGSAASGAKGRGASRSALLGVLVILAVRGLRPRRYRTLLLSGG
jgi:hypothetical protein